MSTSWGLLATRISSDVAGSTGVTSSVASGTKGAGAGTLRFGGGGGPSGPRGAGGGSVAGFGGGSGGGFGWGGALDAEGIAGRTANVAASTNSSPCGISAHVTASA